MSSQHLSGRRRVSTRCIHPHTRWWLATCLWTPGSKGKRTSLTFGVSSFSETHYDSVAIPCGWVLILTDRLNLWTQKWRVLSRRSEKNRRKGMERDETETKKLTITPAQWESHLNPSEKTPWGSKIEELRSFVRKMWGKSKEFSACVELM